MRQSLDYLIRRFTFSVITLCVILVFNFFLFRVIPGDPAQMLVTPQMTIESREKIRQEFGLDKPLWFNVQAVRKTGEVGEIFDSQFFYYAKNLLKGNLGESFRQKRPVVEILADRIGPTVLVIVTGEIIAIIFGTFAGMIAAWKNGTKIDTALMVISLFFYALPPFLLGIVLLIFARGHLPMSGFITPGVIYASTWEKYVDIGSHLILPSITLAFMLLGAYMIIMRNSTLEVLSEDYVLTAKAKGISPLRVLKDHVLRNASLPLATIIALDLGFALGGLVQIEMIFSWPGLGSLMLDAIGQRDYPVLQAVFLVLSVVVICANFLADLVYVVIDPRIESQR